MNARTEVGQIDDLRSYIAALEANGQLHRVKTEVDWKFELCHVSKVNEEQKGPGLLYAVYRAKNPADFHYASLNLDTKAGAINTGILLTSSLTMVLAIGMLERRNRKASFWLLVITIAFGIWFLINKYIEWSHKIHHGIFPGSEELTGRTAGENLFYSLYFLMTGLLGIHVIAGLIVLGFMAWMVACPHRRSLPITDLPEGMRANAVSVTVEYGLDPTLDEQKMIRLENAGLYWHLVDVIWIFLFPLFYLIS